MGLWVWISIAVYGAGFALVLALNLTMGPVTPGLSLLRAILWPWFILTGGPQGERF